jgi:hypothetical protein
MSMRALLADTTEWWQWTQRTQVLAAAAAGTDVVRAWLAEEPESVPAAVMWARVAVERALRVPVELHVGVEVAARAGPHDRCVQSPEQILPGGLLLLGPRVRVVGVDFARTAVGSGVVLGSLLGGE